MNWNELLSEERLRNSGAKKNTGANTDYRTEFERDYHRIVGSAYFRRLQDKTQVYSLDGNDFVRTRLTHSLEVSSFAKSLGKSVGLRLCEMGKIDYSQAVAISDILMCAGLIHDIGNPPFGHYGETVIRDWFGEQMWIRSLITEDMWNDFTHFEGNAQSLRIVSRLHHLKDDKGMNLTKALLNTIIKYPISSAQIGKVPKEKPYKKMGYFQADKVVFDDVTSSTGAYDKKYPLMLLLEAADDIAYCTADIEDGMKKGYLSFSLMCDLSKGLRVGDIDASELLCSLKDEAGDKPDREMVAVQNFMVIVQSYLIKEVTNNFVNETNYEKIMNGEFDQDLFEGTGANLLAKKLKKIAFEYIFQSNDIIKRELAADTIVRGLLDEFVPAMMQYDADNSQGIPIKMSSKKKKLVGMIPEQYLWVYKKEVEQAEKMDIEGTDEQKKAYFKLLAVTDYISGMTDHYARDLFRELRGIY